MKTKINYTKIFIVIMLSNLLTMSCLGIFSRSPFEEGSIIETEYFSFTEPVLKENRRAYRIDDYSSFVTIESRDEEVWVVLSLDDGGTSVTSRFMEKAIDTFDIRNHGDLKDIEVADFPGMHTEFSRSSYNEASVGEINVVNLEDRIYFTVYAQVTSNDLETAEKRYKDEVLPMLDMIMDSVEFFNLADF